MRWLVSLLVLPALLLTGCASVEEQRGANLLETKQQMWAEDGHDGPLPALDAASVAQSVIGLATSPSGC